jgi:hypothetical protein
MQVAAVCTCGLPLAVGLQPGATGNQQALGNLISVVITFQRFVDTPAQP